MVQIRQFGVTHLYFKPASFLRYNDLANIREHYILRLEAQALDQTAELTSFEVIRRGKFHAKFSLFSLSYTFTGRTITGS